MVNIHHHLTRTISQVFQPFISAWLMNWYQPQLRVKDLCGCSDTGTEAWQPEVVPAKLSDLGIPLGTAVLTPLREMCSIVKQSRNEWCKILHYIRNPDGSTWTWWHLAHCLTGYFFLISFLYTSFCNFHRQHWACILVTFWTVCESRTSLFWTRCHPSRLAKLLCMSTLVQCVWLNWLLVKIYWLKFYSVSKTKYELQI